MMLASCGGTKDAGQNGTLIERSDIKIEGKRMTPEALWAMGRIGSVAVSPDEKQIAYSVAYYSVPENKSNNELFVMNADGSSNRQITRDSWQESQPVWIKDGKKIAFLCNESGSSQVWEMNPDGTERKQLRGRHRGIRFLARRKEAAFHCAGKNRTEHRRQASRPAQGNRYHRYRLDVQALGRMGNNRSASLRCRLRRQRHQQRTGYSGRRTLRKPDEALGRYRAAGMEPVF